MRLPWATLHTRDRVDERGFRGATADTIARTLERQAPWVAQARAAQREDARMPFAGFGTRIVARTTQLMRSVVAGDEQRVSELLATGAAPCSVSGDAYTALHYAALTGRAEIAKLLCAAPGGAAALALCDKYGNTPLSLAASRGGGGEGLVAALLEAVTADALVNLQNMRGSTALACASENGYEGAVRLLLAHGARQELQNEDGHTALHLAVSSRHADIVRLLCAAPGAAAALALRDKWGRTPLMLAASRHDGHNECLVEALLEEDAAGATVDAQDEEGRSALMWASNRGHEDALRLLLARGARQELQDEDGRAALHFAAGKGRADIVRLLCAAPGAASALTLRDKAGSTPLALAVSRGHSDCEAVMRAHGPAE